MIWKIIIIIIIVIIGIVAMIIIIIIIIIIIAIAIVIVIVIVIIIIVIIIISPVMISTERTTRRASFTGSARPVKEVNVRRYLTLWGEWPIVSIGVDVDATDWRRHLPLAAGGVDVDADVAYLIVREWS